MFEIGNVKLGVISGWSEELNNELVKAAENIKLRPCPSWLGKFNFAVFGGVSYAQNKKLPEGILRDTAKKLASLVPEQRFNVAFIQKYVSGDFVAEHRDPKNNIDQTIIFVFGDWKGAYSYYQTNLYTTNPGNVVIQPCTINGVQGKEHSVDKITEGARWALILNTIV